MLISSGLTGEAGASAGDLEDALLQAARALDARDARGTLELLSSQSPHPEVLSLRARALLLADRPSDAREALYLLQDLRPEWPELDLMLGLSHYRLAQWEVATAHLARAAEARPASGRIQLLLGVAQDHLGDAQAASDALERAQTLDPGLAAAVTYRRGLQAAAAGEHEAARTLLHEVTDRDPERPLARSARLHLRSLDEEVRVLQARISAGVAWDSNANLVGASDGYPISRQRDARAELDLELERVAFTRGPVALRAGYQGSLDLLRHETRLDSATNLGWLRASLDPTERLGVDLVYGIEWGLADFDNFRRVHLFEPALRVIPRDDLQMRVFYRRELRAFFEAPTVSTLDHDGVVSLLGLEQAWIGPDPFGEGASRIRLGAALREEHDQGAELDSRGPVFDAELGLALPWSLQLNVLGRHEQRRFEDPSSFEPLAGDRRDRILEWRIGLARRLDEHFWLASGFRSVHASSNVSLFDHDRQVTDLRLIYRH